MKMLFVILICALCLSGCGVEETFETVGDLWAAPAMADAAQVKIKLPDSMEVSVMDNPDAGKLYICDDFSVIVQTLSGGDLARTVQSVTGYDKQKITIINTEKDDTQVYSCVWSAAGEGGDQICRAVILDDGVYHYAVTVMADYSLAASLEDVWNPLLDSVTLSIG